MVKMNEKLSNEMLQAALGTKIEGKYELHK